MSRINPNNIDAAFPVAGVDNDSQGFRTNFANLKQNLVEAKREIDDLRARAITKAELIDSASAPFSNNMAGNPIDNALLRTSMQAQTNVSAVAGLVVVDASAAHWFTVNAPTAISGIHIDKWPAGNNYYKITLEIFATAASSVDIKRILSGAPASIAFKNVENVSCYDGQNFVFAAGQRYILEFSSIGDASTLTVSHLNNNQVKLPTFDPNVTDALIGKQGDLRGHVKIAADGMSLYVCTANWDGDTEIWIQAPLGLMLGPIMPPS